LPDLPKIESVEPIEKFNWLIQSLMLVAAPYHDQVDSMPAFGAVSDEFALIFDDCLCFLPELMAAGRISEHQAAQLRKIDEEFSRMSTAANKGLVESGADGAR